MTQTNNPTKIMNLMGSKLKLCYKDDHDYKCMSVIVPYNSPLKRVNDGRLEDDPHRNDVVAITFHQSPPFVGVNDCDPDVADMYGELFASAPELFDALYDLYHACKNFNLGQENIREFSNAMEKSENVLDQLIFNLENV